MDRALRGDEDGLAPGRDLSGTPGGRGGRVDAASRRAFAARAHVAGRASGEAVDRSWRVTLNFHPDRLRGDATVLAWLARDGVYRSQFETGTSNGGLTAHPGGDRWRWEQRIFGHAYDAAPASERPKYGALNHRGRRIGAAPRFGSAHLRLREAVLDRATFCFPDSVFEPDHFAVAERCDLLARVAAFDARPRTDAIEAEQGGLLDDYIEAQVHGAVVLAEDVEALVLDPCYRGTPTEAEATALALPLEWHEGRRLCVEELERHPDFRGPRIVDVGRRIAEAGVLDARIVGDAVRAGHEDAQDLKKVWHHVARFGAPIEPPGTRSGA